jgi:ribonuclease J
MPLPTASTQRDGSAESVSRSTERPDLRIWILGGVGEFGRNCTVLEDTRTKKLLIIDAGIMFPGHDLPGVNRIAPDFTDLTARAEDIVGLLITHGHEDHIGAIPQFVDAVGDRPIFLGPLARGLVERKLTESQRPIDHLHTVELLQTVELGPFTATFLGANHSIPQTMGIVVEVGDNLLHFTGDFRLDDMPILGHATDHNSLFDLLDGRRPRFMFVDSTNAGQDGRTRTESSVWTTLRPAVADARGTVYFTTFASHLERQYQALLLAVEYGRRVYVAGRAMRRNVELARKLGIFELPDDLFVELRASADVPRGGLLVLASGSQAEPGSFLDRLSFGARDPFTVGPGDLLVMSSVPIPGNEPRVVHLVDRFLRSGAEVLDYRSAHVHVSGHARNDEIAALVRAVHPQCVIPVHGDHYNLLKCAELASRVGAISTLVLRTGQVVDVFARHYEVSPSEVSARPVYIDDQSDDISERIVRERRVLSTQGAVFVSLAFDGQDNSFAVTSVGRLGFSGDVDLESVVAAALQELTDPADRALVIRKCRDAIYRSIGGPRGSQAIVVVEVTQIPQAHRINLATRSAP